MCTRDELQVFDDAYQIQSILNAQSRGEWHMCAGSKLLLADLIYYEAVARRQQDYDQVFWISEIIKLASIDNYNSESGYDSTDEYNDPQLRLAKHVRMARLPQQMLDNIASGKDEASNR